MDSPGLEVTFRLTRHVGADIRAVVPQLARLRTTVFRDFPYLYDGDPAYEENYLATYVNSPRSVAVLVWHDDKAVGATTALPLVDETPQVRAPFEAAGIDVASVFYLGESVLLDAYRGRGLGVRFFQERESHAKKLGFRVAAFCAVQRPADHPSRPKRYEPLDAFWHKRGYEKREDLTTTFSWQDVGEDHETAKLMTFWLKELA
ncbi:GNAT family N-acetyltransferase [Deinococcus yavapaiensis]|uniref:N-acetyltransferase domain-containing protein n=1 Tax=Deinococcus yavapaiensis KR-236 TaxID=694435 RepID=A0A318SCE8_9DEIO|nr:GNAT family N-acetyltransferase [Deinococcus yavapaiensis]PYE54538.1 hypothetical protein DES52_105176 [Deinococcus yavapaiensis KR-236]